MSGTTDPNAWSEAERLLAQTILLRQPGKPADAAQQRELYIQTLQWARPQERPLLIARSAKWSWDKKTSRSDCDQSRLWLDIYNASDDTPGGNVLQWASLPPGWEIHPQPVAVPRLETYHVVRPGARCSLRRPQAHPRRPSADPKSTLSMASPTSPAH